VSNVLPEGGDRTNLEGMAWRELSRSQELVTERRAYYQAIQDLYFLYDDFNDRRIHNNHAVQMAGLEVSSGLKRRLERKNPG